MVQGTTPTLLFKFSVDLALIKEWRICFYQEGKENLIKTNTDCIVDENKVIYVKLTQEETLNFDVDKYIKIQVKALTQDSNVISSQTITTHTHEILDKMLFTVDNTTPTIIDTSAIEFEFNTEPCGFGLDFENLYIEQTGTGGGGTNGKDGVGIQSVVQTTTSTEDNGKNIITVTLTNGNKSTFVVENGSQGSKGDTGAKGDKGDKGDKGEQGLQGIQGLKGDKGEQGIQGEQGKQGIQGEKGADGYTPIKGKDYFTLEDVQNIVNQVIAQMPIEDAVLANSNNPVKSKAIYEYVELGLQNNLDSANQYSDNVGESANSYTDQELKKLSVKYKSFNNGDTITVEDNTIYTTKDIINNLTILYPTGNFICSFIFTVGDLTQGAISFPTNDSKYIGKAPDFKNGETWELNIHNGIIASGKVVSE